MKFDLAVYPFDPFAHSQESIATMIDMLADWKSASIIFDVELEFIGSERQPNPDMGCLRMFDDIGQSLLTKT